MKRYVVKMGLLLATAVMGLPACETSELDEPTMETSEKEANSLLQIRTRALLTSEEATVSYPVYVYVFSGEQCVATQVIEQESQTLSIPLVEGLYDIYAIGGVSSEKYTLPAQQNASPSMEVALKEGEHHGDLMVGKSSVTLVDGGTNILTLAMERKVMVLQSVVLQKIPTYATAVSVTISPLWKNLKGIAYAGESGQITIPLTRQDDGRTWSFEGKEYILPPSDNSATIMVNVVKADGISSYSYNTADLLEAGYKLNIRGKYTEAVGVTLTGTITGAVWKEEKTISFEFNESGSTTADDDDFPATPTDYLLVDNIPEAGSTYEGCYVLSVTENNGVSEVLLLSSKQGTIGLTDGEEQESAMNKVNAAMASCSVSGIDGWRLMTRAEAQIMNGVASGSIPDKTSLSRYLFVDEGIVKATFMKGNFSPSSNLKSTDILRPVTIVKMKEN